MFSIIHGTLIKHIKNNTRLFFTLVLAFILGISAGAFTVNGLTAAQGDELRHYFSGFLQLFNNQSIDSSELLKVAIMENSKIIILLWILGVTIIGIPFIFLLVGIRGFITGFSSGFIIQTMGIKGVLFTILALVPKEIIMIPCFIALGVSGINFSLNIIKNKSAKHISKEGLKSSFTAYCGVTLFYSCLIFLGVLVEAYVTPVLIRIIIPYITN